MPPRATTSSSVRTSSRWTSRSGKAARPSLIQYDGAGGIELGEASFSELPSRLRFGEFNVLISGQLTDDSKVLMERNIRERVTKVAPFLHADADPYPVVIDGRLMWIVDMYTTSNWYPYSSGADTSRLERVLGLPQQLQLHQELRSRLSSTPSTGP